MASSRLSLSLSLSAGHNNAPPAIYVYVCVWGLCQQQQQQSEPFFWAQSQQQRRSNYATQIMNLTAFQNWGIL